MIQACLPVCMVLKPKYELYIPTYINEIASAIESSVYLNHSVWPYKWETDASNIDWTTPDNELSWNDSYTSFENAIETIKNSFLKKLRKLDTFIVQLEE